MHTILITGNTYPVKEKIKELGGKWDRRSKGWLVPQENAEAAKELVANAPVDNGPRKRSRYRSTAYTLSSGHTIYQNNSGRCEDAPCCGCCS